MSRTKLVIFVISLLLIVSLCSVSFAKDSNYSTEDIKDMEKKLGKVFEFVGLENPQVKISENDVFVELVLPNTYTGESSLSYIIINAAEIASQTDKIIVRISSKKSGIIEASAKTKDALAFSEGKISETDFAKKIKIRNILTIVNIIIIILALIVVLIIIKKVFEHAKINHEKTHIHKHHCVHKFMKKTVKKKKAVKKKVKKSKKVKKKVVKKKK